MSEERLALSYSAVRDYKSCLQLFHYRRVDRIRKRSPAKPLKIGSYVHSLLETYLSGGDPEIVIQQAQEEYDQLWEEEQEELGDLPDLLRSIMKSYKEKYPHDVDLTVAVELSFGGKEDELPAVHLGEGICLKGRIDWVAKGKSKMLTVWDHKTTSKLIPSEGYRLQDLQTSLYMIAAQVLLMEKVRGVGFNYIRTISPTKPHLNKNGTMSKKKINTDLDTLLRFMHKHGLNPEDYPQQVERAQKYTRFSRKIIPKPDTLVENIREDFITTGLDIIDYLENPKPHRNLRRECEQCEFHSLCIAELMDLDVDFLLKAEYKRKEV